MASQNRRSPHPVPPGRPAGAWRDGQPAGGKEKEEEKGGHVKCPPYSRVFKSDSGGSNGLFRSWELSSLLEKKKKEEKGTAARTDSMPTPMPPCTAAPHTAAHSERRKREGGKEITVK